MKAADDQIAVRWRLVLGRHAESRLSGLDEDSRRLDGAMEMLYGRGHSQRGYRPGQGGSLDPSAIILPKWLDTLRELFPTPVFERIQSHAIERFDMASVLANKETLSRLEPNLDLLKVILSYRGRADADTADLIRDLVRRIVRELRERLAKQFVQAMSGVRHRHIRSHRRRISDFDMRATVRANLKNYQPDRKAIIAETLRFTGRRRREIPWSVILCVDQSGSMIGSLIHAVVTASILASLPSVSVRMVLFDTSVVDVSDQLSDPVDLLLSVQLGGGTDIAQAMAYCEGLVTQPSRTVLTLISDFEEGGSPAELVRTVSRLREARVTLLGLAALGDSGEPLYDRVMAGRLAGAGMQIAALTPDRFVEWLGEVIG